MAKNKYCYTIVNKDNGEFLIVGTQLPIYWNKNLAKKVCIDYSSCYMVHRIILDELEKFIIRQNT